MLLVTADARALRVQTPVEEPGEEDAKEGKFAPRPTVPWRTGIHCQGFSSRVTIQYFEVQRAETGPRPPPDGITDQPVRAANRKMQRAFGRLRDEKTQIKGRRSQRTGLCLKRVGYIPLLASVDRKEVQELVEPVDENDEPYWYFIYSIRNS